MENEPPTYPRSGECQHGTALYHTQGKPDNLRDLKVLDATLTCNHYGWMRLDEASHGSRLYRRGRYLLIARNEPWTELEITDLESSDTSSVLVSIPATSDMTKLLSILDVFDDRWCLRTIARRSRAQYVSSIPMSYSAIMEICRDVHKDHHRDYDASAVRYNSPIALQFRLDPKQPTHPFQPCPTNPPPSPHLMTLDNIQLITPEPEEESPL